MLCCLIEDEGAVRNTWQTATAHCVRKQTMELGEPCVQLCIQGLQVFTEFLSFNKKVLKLLALCHVERLASDFLTHLHYLSHWNNGFGKTWWVGEEIRICYLTETMKIQSHYNILEIFSGFLFNTPVLTFSQQRLNSFLRKQPQLSKTINLLSGHRITEL